MEHVYVIPCTHEHGGQYDYSLCQKQRASMQRDLDKAVEAAKHDAWQEGFDRYGEVLAGWSEDESNPYRKEG